MIQNKSSGGTAAPMERKEVAFASPKCGLNAERYGEWQNSVLANEISVSRERSFRPECKCLLLCAMEDDFASNAQPRRSTVLKFLNR